MRSFRFKIKAQSYRRPQGRLPGLSPRPQNLKLRRRADPEHRPTFLLQEAARADSGPAELGEPRLPAERRPVGRGDFDRHVRGPAVAEIEIGRRAPHPDGEDRPLEDGKAADACAKGVRPGTRHVGLGPESAPRASRPGLGGENAIEAGEGVTVGESDCEAVPRKHLLQERAVRGGERREAPVAIGIRGDDLHTERAA